MSYALFVSDILTSRNTDFVYADMTVHTLQEFIPHFLSKLFIDALVYGNVTKQVNMILKPRILNDLNYSK